MDNESELHDCNDCRLEEPMLSPKLLLLLVLCKIFLLAFLIKSVVSKISDVVELIEDWDDDAFVVVDFLEDLVEVENFIAEVADIMAYSLPF